MHRHNRPGDHSAASHLQLLARRQSDLRGVIQKFLLHSVVKFLPPVVREGCNIVENQPVILGVELRRSLRRPRAPSCTKTVDEFTERSVVRGLLLRPGANESQQGADDRQRYIQQPAPSRGIFADGSAYRSGHSVSPRNSGTRVCSGMSQRVTHTVIRSEQFCKRSYTPGLATRFLTCYCPSPGHHSPVNLPSWPNPRCTAVEVPLFSLWGKEIALQEDNMRARRISSQSLKSILGAGVFVLGLLLLFVNLERVVRIEPYGKDSRLAI